MRFIATTEGRNRLRLRELCEQYVNEQWIAVHLTSDQAAESLLDSFKRAVVQEFGLLQVEPQGDAVSDGGD